MHGHPVPSNRGSYSPESLGGVPPHMSNQFMDDNTSVCASDYRTTAVFYFFVPSEARPKAES